MLFNSVQYFIYLSVVVLGYYVFPKRVVNIWLLASSYYFYIQWNKYYIVLIVGVTILTYFAAILVEKKSNEDYVGRRLLLGGSLFICLGLLAFFKYSDFIAGYIKVFLNALSFRGTNWVNCFVLPVGISFYTLQSLGYLIDVYRKDIPAEKNIITYALFISFFPQLVAGPIERSKNLLEQLRTKNKFDFENFRMGGLLILYGVFLKTVVADRIAIIVDTVYSDYEKYNGFLIIIATIFFAFQIYCDFYGYSTIARGSALLMGVSLIDNFNAPYYSRSVKEFWRRWHISLSTWFRDYVYIPLGGNRCGKIRKSVNLLTVFGLSGLWHGAALSYVTWGLLNAIYQIIGDTVARMKGKVRGIVASNKFEYLIPQSKRFSRKLFNLFFTFLCITFAWMFFRAGSLSESLSIVSHIFPLNNWEVFFDETLFSLGVEKNMFEVMICGIGVLLFVDYNKFRGRNVVEAVLKQGLWARTICFVGLATLIILFGCYGEIYDTQQFIYFQF